MRCRIGRRVEWAQEIVYYVGQNTGDTRQIGLRLNNRPAATSGSATGGGDATCSQITLGNVVRKTHTLITLILLLEYYTQLVLTVSIVNGTVLPRYSMLSPEVALCQLF